MEIWLSYNNQTEKFQLPVLPAEFTISKGNLNQTVNINEIGEIGLIGKPGLAKINLSSFFPAQEYPFCQYTGFPEPYDCTKMIERWKDSRQPIRLIITGTGINMAVSIDDFSYGERDGSGDVYYSLDLKEYRFLTVPGSGSGAAAASSAEARPVTKETPKDYVVKSGDSLWAIAKLLTGDGANYKTIANKNGIKDPAKIYPGQKLVIS